MKNVAVLVTGSREWEDHETIDNALREIVDLDRYAWRVLIHGDCEGADLDAEVAADNQREWQNLPMPAPWDTYPNNAGPIRNSCMVKLLEQLRTCGYECHVLAFPMPSSIGTHDCIAKAKRAGFDVRVFEPRSAAK